MSKLVTSNTLRFFKKIQPRVDEVFNKFSSEPTCSSSKEWFPFLAFLIFMFKFTDSFNVNQRALAAASFTLVRFFSFQFLFLSRADNFF